MESKKSQSNSLIKQVRDVSLRLIIAEQFAALKG